MVRPFLVGGEWRTSDHIQTVIFPYDGSVSDEVCLAMPADLVLAIEKAVEGFQITRRLATYQRAEILFNLHHLMQRDFGVLVELMIMESGKTRKVAEAEAARALQTVLTAAEETKRLSGEILNLDWTPTGANHRGMVRRFPIGVVVGITPFNYPLNLACHKLAPAMGTGNAIIIKPPEIAPLSSLKLAELVLEAGYPPAAFSMVPCEGLVAETLVTDNRVAMVTFTGSARVGWMLKSKAGRKKVTLELGGNAPVIVHEDADLNLVITKTVQGSFTNAGQNCISVQRLLVHQPIFDDFQTRFIHSVEKLIVGDPREAQTDVGPMIHHGAVERTFTWIQEAVADGAVILTGGTTTGLLFRPTVLTNVQMQMKVCLEEVFAPVVSLIPYDTWEAALAMANDSDYGLQAGVFTRDMGRILQAWEQLEMGGVHVNDTSTFRVDHMPYGGVKGSGLGREGIRYAMEDMTELRLLSLNF